MAGFHFYNGLDGIRIRAQCIQEVTALKIITDMSQVPVFSTETEEAEFWNAHAFTEHLLSTGQISEVLPPTRQAKSNPVSLRLSRGLEQRLRALAEIKGTSYQTLLKEFVLERVYEEEKRHHIV